MESGCNSFTAGEKSTQIPLHKLSDDVKQTVLTFYQQSDMSWMSPGKKDFVNIEREKTKEDIQKFFDDDYRGGILPVSREISQYQNWIFQVCGTSTIECLLEFKISS